MRKKDFIKICRMDQPTLKEFVSAKLLDAGYKQVNSQDGFVYAKGDLPVLLTAHLDTVHEALPKHVTVTNEGVISSPNGIGGDDRCGVFIILSLLKETDLRPSILFCEDEETGGEGSDKFCLTGFIRDLENLNFLIEIDRQGKDDAVFYNCGNAEFMSFVEKETGFHEAWGTFSDISNLSPECGVASVNLSCGYYKQHTKEEYVVWNEVVNSKETIAKLIKAGIESGQFRYEELSWSNYGYNNGSNYGYNNDLSDFVSLYICYVDPEDKMEYDCEYYGISKEEAFGDFFIDHPNCCFNDIVDWYVLSDKKKYAWW